MSQPVNPFAQNVPAQSQPAATAQAPANPFAQQQAAPAAAPQQQYAQPVQQHVQQPAQAYAPQAPANPYAQQQPTQTYPNYGAPAQQQAAPAPTAVTPQHYAAPQGSMPALGTATAPPPPPPSGGKGANVADMYGRLVIIFPHVVQNVPKRPQHITDEQRARGDVNQDRMTATVVVLDGGSPDNMAPIAFGGNPHVLGGRPHDQSAPLPYVRKGMWINQSKVIAQVSDYMPGRSLAGPNGAPGAAVGRLVKEGPEQNAAWYLTTPNEAELNLANAYLGLVMQGQYPHPLAP